MHTAIHKLLYSIANEHFEKYKYTSKKYNLLTDNNKQWDLLSHTKDENEQYFSLYSDKTKYAIITVVFLVMSIEGLINEYGLVYLGKSRFMELERESIREKLVTFFNEASGNKFPTDRKLYQSIKDLIDVRNTLVHSKSIEIDINVLLRTDVEAEEVFNGYINSIFGNGKRKSSRQKSMERVLESSHNVYIELMEYLQQNTGEK
ncbi:hypothetical protein [Bacillus sp. V5-8f]|uniref:hypothetical protein n=1 Tax=Bacillus sp. V5-8f TaxID=2053044 RepID=UPI000C76684E|nr:hypothetical protein [Bacillus sp. V5-8f]PLT32525.1 hypothetical protein CUU64_18645 [Bacillus sp. V5-8f]